MPTSGTYLWSAPLAECFDEAFERCGIDPSTLDISHINSARRAVSFMFVDWATEDFQDFRIDRITQPLVQGTQSYTVDPDTDGRIIDITQVSLRRDNTDTTIYPMSRQEWLDIPNKDFEGRPSRFFADKRQDSVIIYLWTVPENSTDVLIIDAARKFQDVGENGVTEPDVPYYMRDAFAAGLAGRLSNRYAQPQMVPGLKAESEIAFRKANAAQRVLGDVVIVPSSGYLRRAGRRRR